MSLARAPAPFQLNVLLNKRLNTKPAVPAPFSDARRSCASLPRPLRRGGVNPNGRRFHEEGVHRHQTFDRIDLDDDGTDWYAGVGVSYSFTDRFDVGLAYDHYRASGDAIDLSPDVFSLTTESRF